MILPRLTGAHVPRFVNGGRFRQSLHRDGAHRRALAEGRARRDAAARRRSRRDRRRRSRSRCTTCTASTSIHLDLKPSNVIMREDGEAALIDFGLSRHDQLPDLLAEEIPAPIGTGPYISPEQVQGERGDPRSDLFALGVILYFLATGERPFGEPASAREWRRAAVARSGAAARLESRRCRRGCRRSSCAASKSIPHARPRDRRGACLRAAQSGVRRAHRARRAHEARRASSRSAARWLRSRQAGAAAAAPQHRGASCARADHHGGGRSCRPDTRALSEAVAVAVSRLLATEPGARLACVNVLKSSLLRIDPVADAQGPQPASPAAGRAEALGARAARARPSASPFMCSKRSDAAAALIDFARANRADHIVIGARASSALRRYLGSVSAQVVAEAPCTVTVVRARAEPEDVAPEPAGGHPSSNPG